MAKDFTVMTPRAVEAYFRQLILDTFGNKAENASSVTSGHGSYNVNIRVDESHYEFRFKKKTAAKIAKAIRALGA